LKEGKFGHTEKKIFLVYPFLFASFFKKKNQKEFLFQLTSPFIDPKTLKGMVENKVGRKISICESWRENYFLKIPFRQQLEEIKRLNIPHTTRNHPWKK